MQELQLIPFITDDGKEPFAEFLLSLDATTQRRMLARLARIQAGNFGDCKPIIGGVFELRFFFGDGNRIYFGKYRERIIILLCGGNKSSQNKDITKAKQYWKQYQDQKIEK